MLERLCVWLWEWDLESDRIVWNGPALCESWDELLALVHANDREGLEQAIRTRASQWPDFRFTKPDGNEGWFMSRIAGVEGNLCGVLVEITDRRPAPVEWPVAGVGLLAALRWYIEGYIERGGVRVDLDAPAELPSLGRAVEATLFRVVQEALANIQRDARGSTAWIRLAVRGGEVALEISGGGATAFGAGIAAIRARIEELGGRLLLEPGPLGTVLTVVLPPS
ncbi:MAG: hypothetical protein ACRD96_16645 [Bryobacteraceae bacterium]